MKNLLFVVVVLKFYMFFQKVLGIQPVIFPIKYLGLPLLVGSPRLINFNDLLDKLASWLKGWKSKLLSVGGRLKLLRAFVNGMLTY